MASDKYRKPRIIRPGPEDPDGNLPGGTEARTLVAFDNKVFAAIGCWTVSVNKMARCRFSVYSVSSCLSVFRLFLGLLLVTCVAGLADSSAEAREAAGVSISWQESFVAGSDPDGNLMGGTETRTLVAFDNKVFAAIGRWTDKEAKDPDNPGPQVVMLDRPESEGGRWRLDLHLADRTEVPGPRQGRRRYVNISTMDVVTFRRDRNAKDLTSPVSLLVLGVWDSYDALEVFTRDVSGPESWARSVIIPHNEPVVPERRMHVRSFAQHRDSVTGVDLVFAGTSGRAAHPRRIYHGTYNPKAPGCIAWGEKPEAWAQEPNPDDRVTSFATANGKLYASVCGKIYERVDGETPRWRLVFANPNDRSQPSPGEWGYRGLTAIGSTSSAGEVLIGALEGTTSSIDRLDVSNDYAVREELDVIDRLGREWKRSWVGYTIVAYNRFVPMTLAGGERVHFAGLEARIAHDARGRSTWYGWEPGAWYFVRHANGSYDLGEIVDPAKIPKPALVATRTLLPSPFADESGRVIYAGGFDCNRVNEVNHNTAWIYRGEILASEHGKLSDRN